MSQPAIVQHILDHTYARFVAELPRDLQATADSLPLALRLTTHAAVPWSAVFNNSAVLALPLLVASGRARLPAPLRAVATEAHLFAVISAFGLDRIEDRQIDASPRVVAVIHHIRQARDHAFRRLVAGAPGFTRDFAWAERVTRTSQIAERRVLVDGEPTSMAAYTAVSLQKQALAFPACTAAAAVAGWSAEDRAQLEAIVAGASLGLQYRDDVVDWIDDQQRGGAWPVALLVAATGAALEDTSITAIGRRLHAADVLCALLELSRAAFTRAAAAAHSLGVAELAAWAHDQASLTAELKLHESHAPGHAVAWELARRARREEKLQALVAA